MARRAPPTEDDGPDRLPAPAHRARAVASVVVLVVLTLAAGGRAASAQETALNPALITLDGDFGEWGEGSLHVHDPVPEPRDQKEINDKEDVSILYWGTNEGESWLYFKVDRFAQRTGAREGIDQPVYYGIYIDFNNNGDYRTNSDFVVFCAFDPSAADPGDNALVYVVPAPAVFYPPGHGLDPNAIIYQAGGRWGEPYDRVTRRGGLQVEFGVPFDAFRPPFEAAQTIRFYLGATLNDPLNKLDYPHQDFVPDPPEDIQDAPVPTLGLLGTVFLLAVGLAMAYSSFHGRLRAAAGRKAGR